MINAACLSHSLKHCCSQMCRQTFGIAFFLLFNTKRWETCTGTPSSGGTSHSTSDCRTPRTRTIKTSRGRSGGTPVRWVDLLCRFEPRRDELPFEQAARQSVHDFVPFPVRARLKSTRAVPSVEQPQCRASASAHPKKHHKYQFAH